MGFLGSFDTPHLDSFLRAQEKVAQRVAQSSQNNRESIDFSALSEMQKKTLTSFLNVVKDIAWRHGIKAFAEDQQLYEACAELESETYRCGRDLLLTIFMKRIPQQFAQKRLTSGKASWDADTEEILTDELGMDPFFVKKMLSILQTQLEECKKG